MKLFLGLWVLALGALGCSGELVDPSDEGGGRGEAADEITAACEDWCESYTSQCDYSGSCTDHCLEHATYLRPCAAEYETLVRCEAGLEWLDSPSCNAAKGGSACEAELGKLLDCVYPTGACESQCTAGEPGAELECTYLCGEVTYISACNPSGSDGAFPMDCACQIDGEDVGKCQNVTADGSAGLGCCSSYFAERPQRAR